ncbi:receptor-like protein kinase FERONIA [Panicum hallii]|jgi:serine/threonine protein kinase|uniref:receptor-like protein kinase FERONIA n=1 Tax=Panicum hallii TaxID=206008 RepID=UPI000DF4DB38|nr:receptor-like protein kinase FERONIA [Panicum hallii]
MHLLKLLQKGLRGVRALFDAEIASQNNTKILDGVAKLAGKCLLMERGRRPEMIDVVERLRKLGKASHQVHQRVDLFSWARKRKPMTTWTSNLCRQFSLEEIKAATRNFDESLLVNATRILPPFVNPDEIFGSRVYRGVIDGGATKVAIKLPSYRHGAGGCELRSAIEMRSKLRHGHIVPLIGYCDEDNETILVYDFMACVSLHYHLYENQQEPRLTWKQRLEICIGVARGLHYLHRGTKHAIIHGSLKSANIFLDKNWVAKIIDGGLSSDNASDHWVLSFNFLGVNPRDLTEESDVLAFGALLFEAQSRSTSFKGIRVKVGIALQVGGQALSVS